MKKKKDNFYKKNRVLKTAMEGYDEGLPNPDGGYSRSDEKRQIEEALEELEDDAIHRRGIEQEV